ncbi:g191 [Coccomyxa elongata]
MPFTAAFRFGAAQMQLDTAITSNKADFIPHFTVTMVTYKDTAESLNDEAEDFYAIFGVAPDASPQEIKKAYHRIMRACHPDVVGLEEVEADEGSAEEVCVFVNDMYETLMDKEKREAYDAIAGFSGTAMNPFRDTNYERNQVFVSEYDCIGCKNCTNVCPHTFAIEDEYGRARAMRQGVDSDELLQEAIDTCPVNCIHWVTSPQLALLETTMAKMERVDAWILMMGGGNGVDVFMEAATAWEKRQARIRARREGARHSWMPWGGQAAATANTYNGYSSGASAATGGRAQEAAAATAASARKWRDFQRSRQRSAVGHLPQSKK